MNDFHYIWVNEHGTPCLIYYENGVQVIKEMVRREIIGHNGEKYIVEELYK